MAWRRTGTKPLPVLMLIQYYDGLYGKMTIIYPVNVRVLYVVG